MADEEQNENVEETTPEAVEAADAPEAAKPAAEKAPAQEPAAEAGPPASPKERRQQSRARRATRSGAQPVRSPEERQAEREATRAKKAKARIGARAKARAKQSETRAANPAEATAPREHAVGRQKERQGIVVSDKADKTITVRIDTARQHRRYHKIVRSSSTLHVHDESNDAHTGDTVVVRECRPLSRLKRWRLVQVVERAK